MECISDLVMNRLNKISAAMAAIAVVYLAPLAAWAQPEVYLSTQRTESKLVEVATPPFMYSWEDRDSLGEKAARIVNYDLKFTRFFKPNENYPFLRQAQMADLRTGRVNYREWRTLASNFLIKGSIEPADGKLSVEVRVYDIQTRKLFFAKRYVGARTIFRKIIHQFSDDLLMRLTGEKGVAKTKIAFVSRVKGRKELFIMDYDGHSPRAVTRDNSIVLFPNWNHKDPNLVLFTTYRYRNPDIYALNLATNVRYPISRKVGLNATGEWSPDGSKVAFSLSRRGDSDIYVCNADGSGLTQLTRHRSIETNPSWSPDGKNIAFTSDRSGSPQIYVMDATGGRARRLTYKGGYNDGASWSPKGDTIVYTSLLNSKFDIAMIGVHDRAVVKLTNGLGSNESPSWAPNGKHIVFSSSRTGLKQIYTMNSDGSNLTQATFLSGGGYLPSWGPE